MLISAVEFFLISSGDLFFLMNEKDESINLRATSRPNKTHSNFFAIHGTPRESGEGERGERGANNSREFLHIP